MINALGGGGGSVGFGRNVPKNQYRLFTLKGILDNKSKTVVTSERHIRLKKKTERVKSIPYYLDVWLLGGINAQQTKIISDKEGGGGGVSRE